MKETFKVFKFDDGSYFTGYGDHEICTTDKLIRASRFGLDFDTHNKHEVDLLRGKFVTATISDDEQPTFTTVTVSDDEQPTNTLTVSDDEQPTNTLTVYGDEQPTNTLTVYGDEQPTNTLTVYGDEQPTNTRKEPATFKGKIAMIKREQNLSEKTLSKIIGCGKSTIHDWLHGSVPSRKFRKEIEDLYKFYYEE